MDAHAPQQQQQQHPQQEQQQQANQGRQEHQEQVQQQQPPSPPRRPPPRQRQRQQRATNRSRPQQAGASRKNIPLAPSWYGIVMTTTEALRLFEACLSGRLLHAARRPHDTEKDTLIRSGSIFIYETTACGIKRWTDNRKWSPSRILGNFLIYREMRHDIQPPPKKKATKRKRGEEEDISDDETVSHGMTDPSGPPVDEALRALVGSLTSTKLFQEGGLMKKTISINYKGSEHHMVSYYTVEDAMSGRLPTPSQFPELNMIRPRRDILVNQEFRVPMAQDNPQLLQEVIFDDARAYGHGPQPYPEQPPIPLPQMPMPMPMSMLQPYSVPAPMHPSHQVNQSSGPGMHMGGSFDHNTSHSMPMPWGHQALPPPTAQSYDFFIPSTTAPGPDMVATSQDYYASPATTAYAPPTSLPPTTQGTEAMGYMPAVTSMASPPPMDMMADVPGRTMDFSPPVSSMSRLAMDYSPSVGAMDPLTNMGYAPSGRPQVPTGHLDSTIGGPPVNLPSMLPPQPAATLDGSPGEPQYYQPLNTAGWDHAPHHGAYYPGQDARFNGWPSGSQPGDQY